MDAMTDGSALPVPYDAGDFDRWTKIIAAAERKSNKDKSDFDKYVRQYREGRFPIEEKNGVSLNQTFTYVMILMATLYNQGPSMEVEPREGGDAAAFGPVAGMFGGDPETARRRFAEGLEACLHYAGEELAADNAHNACLFEALVRGQGWSKITFDSTRMLPRVDTFRRDEIYVDPHARYSLSQARYIIHTAVMQIDEAREFFRKNYGLTQGIEPNWQLSEGEGLSAQKAKSNEPHGAKDQFRFYEIWCKKGEKSREVYYKAFKGEGWLVEPSPWPFSLATDDYCFQHLHFNTQYTSLGDAFTELQVVDGLTQMQEECFEFYRRSALRGLSKPVLLDESAFSDDDLADIAAGKHLGLKRVNRGDKPMTDLVHVLDLNTAYDPSRDIADIFGEKRDKVLGLDELQQGFSGRQMTAEEAGIRDEQAKLRTGRRQKDVDTWLGGIARTCAQVMRQLTPPEIIAKIAGRDVGLLFSLYGANADDFLNEYSIGVAAGSTGERAKQKRIQRLREHLNDCMLRNDRAMQRGEPPIYDEDALIVEIADQNGLRRPERYKLPPPEPAMQQPAMMQWQPQMPAPQPEQMAGGTPALPGGA